MKLEIKVSNYRGIKSGNIVLESGKPTLIMAPNGHGKTSLCQAVGSVIAQNPIPIEGFKKNMASRLVRIGSTKGSISATLDESVNWGFTLPECVVDSSGELNLYGGKPDVVGVVSGRKSFFAHDDKSQASILNAALSVLPTQEDWIKASTRSQITEKVRNSLWESICTIGWDDTHKRAVEKGQTLKGQWTQVTRENYGSKKAQNWIPEGWGPEVIGAREEELMAAVADANTALEAALKDQGASEGEMNRLLELASYFEVRKSDAEDAEASLKAARSAFLEAEQELANIPKSGAKPNCKCPKCGAGLLIQGQNLMEATEPDQDLIQKRRTQEAVVADLKTRLDNAAVQLEKIMAGFKESLDACNKVHGNGQVKVGGEAEVSRCRAELETAKVRLNAFKAKQEADRINSAIEANLVICELLDKEGIRKECLIRRLDSFNNRLLAKLGFGYKIELGADLQVTLDELNYPLLSKSQQWVCEVSMQIAIAIASKSQAVVIDAADMIDDVTLAKFVHVIKSLPIAVMVGITVDVENGHERVIKALEGVVSGVTMIAVENKDKRSGITKVVQ